MNRYDIAKGLTIEPRPPKLSKDPPSQSLDISEEFDPYLRATVIRVAIPEMRIQMSSSVNTASYADKGYVLATMRDEVHARIDSLFKPHTEKWGWIR